MGDHISYLPQAIRAQSARALAQSLVGEFNVTVTIPYLFETACSIDAIPVLLSVSS